FNLFIQSKEQLVEKYGQEITKIVLDNCHFWIYLKSGGETCDMISQKLGKYTVESSSSSSSLNNNGLFATPTNSGSTSTSTQLMARDLLAKDEIAKINRPYLLVLADNGYPSLLKSPDLSEWNFNKMLGLGDKEFNKKVRMFRDNLREVKFDNYKINLWDFKPYIDRLLIEKIREMEDNSKEELLSEIANNFNDF
ncbi:MAG: TraM recognition domain-containing protein, partial [Oscillospiraceae bacterium]